MLTHPTAIKIFNSVCRGSAEWMAENEGLLASAAWVVYRKCGRQEAQAFIALIRLAQIVPVK